MKKTLSEPMLLLIAILIIGASGVWAGPKEINYDGRFIAYDNGTVKRYKTGLMWAAKDNGEDMNWAAAKRYCENYRGGGYADWRMPTVEELKGLAEPKPTYLVEIRHLYITMLIELSSTGVWASETDGSKAHGYSFDYPPGPFVIDQSLSDDYRALPVRSGK